VDLSKQESYDGYSVCLTSNECHDASRYLKRVLKDVGIESTIVTYETRDGGGEHSYLIVSDYFGPNRHLVIDPTIKQFMPHTLHDQVHDIFVGSTDELLNFMRRYRVVGIGHSNTPDEAFQLYLQATATGRFD
jgi:hypothetical protein